MSEVSEKPKSLADSLKELSPNLPFTDIPGIPSDGHVERLEDGRVLVVTKGEVSAAIKYGKYITFVNVLGALAKNGGVPAVQKMPDGTNEIRNAAAAMEQFITVVRGQDHVSFQGQGERWKSIVDEACNRVNEACFKVLPPEVKFEARF